MGSFLRVCGVLLCLAALCLAQSEVGTATVNGTVTDSSGAAVPAAKVTAVNRQTGTSRTTDTSESGLYNMARLPVGAYDISVEASGFKSLRRNAVDLAVGAVLTLDFPLEVGAATEQVTVNADVPVVETTRSQTSTVVTEKQVNELPINGRNFLDFTLLTPGVVRDPTRGGDLSFGGQRGTANSLLVDGSDSNNVFFGQSTGRSGTGRNPYSFSQDAVQEFQVSANGYGAEVGRAGGGVINVITKSGTNQFHGGGFEFFRDRALNANTWRNNRDGRVKGAYHYNQFGANLGGPIKRNKLFFFFNYDGQRNTTPNPVFLQRLPAASDTLGQQAVGLLQRYLTPYNNALNNNVYLGKVDWDISNGQRLTIRYNANRFRGGNFENTGPASAFEHTGDSNVTTDNLAGVHTAVLNAASVLESRFTWTRDNEPGFANSNAPEAQIREGGITVLNIGRNNFSPRFTNAKTVQWVESLSYVTGRHSLKFGSDINWQKIDNFFPGNFGGSFIFNSLADFAANRPASFTQGFAGDSTDGALTQPNVNEYAFYAQDSWRTTDRLTLNYGIRYDFFQYAQPKVKNPDPALAAMNIDTSKIPLDKNNFAPRFGFAYKVTDSGTVAVRGGYGIYYGRTPSILTGTAFSQNGIQVQTYSITTGIPTYPAILSAPPTATRIPSIYAFAPDYRQPLTHQWSFNVETQLAADYALTVGYLGVRGEHLSRTRDINLFPSVATQGFLVDGSSTTFYRHPSNRPAANFGRISLFDSGADSIYHAGFIQLTKRFSQRFQLQTSYTFSKVIDTNPDFTSVVVGGGDDAKVAQDTLLPNLDRARGNADIPHRFVFAGTWDLSYANHADNRAVRYLFGGYQFSTIVNAQSGRVYTATIASDVNNDGNSRNDRPPYIGRNTIRGPRYETFDMRVTRDFGTERMRLRLMFEAFNVFNRANFSSLNTSPYTFNTTTRVFTPNAAYLQLLDTFDPRILQLAARFSF